MKGIEAQKGLSDRGTKEVLEEILREGARRMLQQAIEKEVRVYLERHEHLTDEQGHRMVVGNGHPPVRMLVTGVGPVKIRQRRVRVDAMPARRIQTFLGHWLGILVVSACSSLLLLDMLTGFS